MDTLVTDPPYGMSFQSNHRLQKHARIAGDDDKGLLHFACSIPVRHSAYVFCRWDNLVDVPRPKSCITWVKNNWSMGDLEHEHARQTEVCLFYPGSEHFFPDGRPTDAIKAPRSGNEYHPTEKPVQLMSAIIGWTDGVVCDPFMGSGSTGIAAVRRGRAFVGIEINEEYFDIACKRISEELRQPELFTQRERRENHQSSMFDERADSIGSFNEAITEIGRRYKSGEPIPETSVYFKDTS